jgi:Cysteine-rich secretory protein family
MTTTLRRFTILAALALLALLLTPTSHASHTSASRSARPQAGAPEAQLLEAANRERAAAGLRFSLIAENIAEGPSANNLHQQWMNSPPHRANLLDPELNAVGIAVVQGAGILFAVEDFSAAVPALNLDAQELQVASLLSAHFLRLVSATDDARRTCDMDRGWVGQKPLSVMRYETTDLSRLPDDVEQKLQGGRFRTAAVGACDAGSSSGFTRFRIAILLF